MSSSSTNRFIHYVYEQVDALREKTSACQLVFLSRRFHVFLITFEEVEDRMTAAGPVLRGCVGTCRNALALFFAFSTALLVVGTWSGSCSCDRKTKCCYTEVLATHQKFEYEQKFDDFRKSALSLRLVGLLFVWLRSLHGTIQLQYDSECSQHHPRRSPTLQVLIAPDVLDL